MPEALPLFGKNVTMKVLVDNRPFGDTAETVDFSAKEAGEIVKDDLLGRENPRGDYIEGGWDVKLTYNWAKSDLWDAIELVRAAHRERTRIPEITILMIWDLRDGSGASKTFAFEKVQVTRELGAGGRKERVKAPLEAWAESYVKVD